MEQLLITEQQDAALINRFAAIPLEKRELLVNMVMRKLNCAEDRKLVYRHLYMLFLKADMLKGISWQ